MAYITRKIVFFGVFWGAQMVPVYSMQLLSAAARSGVRKSVCPQLILSELALRKTTRSGGSRLFSRSRNGLVSEETWFAAQQLLLDRAAKQAEDLVATISLAQVRLDQHAHSQNPDPERAKIQRKEKRATLALNAMYLQLSQAEQWVRTCTQRAIDLEYMQDGKPLSEPERQALALAHKDKQEAGISVRKAKEGLAQAQLELRVVQKELNTIPVPAISAQTILV